MTEDGLHFLGLLPYNGLQPITNISNDLVKDLVLLDVKSPLIATMATCHSLTHIQGSLAGDPLDLSMFNATKWVSVINFCPNEFRKYINYYHVYVTSNMVCFRIGIR